MGWGGLQLATRQCDSEVLKGLPDWTRSASSHTRFDGLSKHTSAAQTNERVGWGGGVGGGGWGGLQLATRQCDSEVLKGLPDWTRSTSSHTHTRFDGLSKHTSAAQTNERVGWGVLNSNTEHVLSFSLQTKKVSRFLWMPYLVHQRILMLGIWTAWIKQYNTTVGIRRHLATGYKSSNLLAMAFLVVAMASNLLALTRVPKRYRSRVPKRTNFCVPKRPPHLQAELLTNSIAVLV